MTLFGCVTYVEVFFCPTHLFSLLFALFFFFSFLSVVCLSDTFLFPDFFVIFARVFPLSADFCISGASLFLFVYVPTMFLDSFFTFCLNFSCRRAKIANTVLD